MVCISLTIFVTQAMNNPLGYARYECYSDLVDANVYESCTGWVILNDGSSINFGTVVDDNYKYVTSTVYGSAGRFPKPATFYRVTWTENVSPLI